MKSLDAESNGQPHEDGNVYPADALSTPRQILFVGTCTAMFTNQVGLGNTLATVGVIGESFGITNQGQLSWLIAGYSLTIGTFILIGGRLGDEFSNKRMFVIGMSWYSLWSLVAGLSVYSSHVLFVFARVFQGMGPALTLPNGLAILGQSCSPGPRKNMSFAWFGASAPFGAIAGFVFGGLFARALVAVDLLEPGDCSRRCSRLRCLDNSSSTCTAKAESINLCKARGFGYSWRTDWCYGPSVVQLCVESGRRCRLVATLRLCVPDSRCAFRRGILLH